MTKAQAGWDEASTEREIARCVKAVRASDKCLWVAGYWAARVVGTYAEYGAQAIAIQAGRSPSSVENWAHAWEMYDNLRKFGCNSEPVVNRAFIRSLQNMRRELSPCHFWTAWELKRKYKLKDRQILRFLQMMLDYRADEKSHSVETLRREIESEFGKGGATWDWYRPRVKTMVVNLIAGEDTPDDVRAWAQDAPESVKE